MSKILLVLNCLETACELANKRIQNPELGSFIKEIRMARNSPAGQYIKAKTIQNRLKRLKSRLSSSDQNMLQSNINQSFSTEGLMLPFDEQGNLNIHFDDFLEACNSIDGTVDIGSIAIDNNNAVDTLSDTVESLSNSLGTAIDMTDSVADGADSLWDFISSFFD